MLLSELRDRLALGRRGLGRDRVLQVVIDDRDRVRGDRCAHLVEVDREAIARRQVAVGRGGAAQVLDLRFVDREAGVRVEHLLAGVHDRLQELRDDGLASGHHDDVVGGQLDAATRPEVLGEGLAQLRDAGAGAVTRAAVGDRLVHRLDDVRSRGNVDVAQVEGIHPVPLRLPGGGGLRDAEGGFGAQVFEPVRELLHAVPFLIEPIQVLPRTFTLVHNKCTSIEITDISE